MPTERRKRHRGSSASKRAPHPTARRQALLRHSGAPGRHFPQGHQRAAGARHRRLHPADLTHVTPGMDEAAADTVAALILGSNTTPGAVGHESGHNDNQNVLEKQLAWAKAQASDGSGGRI